MPDIIGTLGDLSGRRLRFVTLPAGFLTAFGRTADLVQRRLLRPPRPAQPRAPRPPPPASPDPAGLPGNPHTARWRTAPA